MLGGGQDHQILAGPENRTETNEAQIQIYSYLTSKLQKKRTLGVGDGSHGTANSV